MNHKNGIVKGIFLSLLFCTLFCLLVPICYQKKIDTVNQAVLSEYKKEIDVIDRSLFDYQKKYNDSLLSNSMLKNAAKPDFTSFPVEAGVIGSITFPTVKMNETPIYIEETQHSFLNYKYGSFPTFGKSTHLVIEVCDSWRNQLSLVNMVQLKSGDCFYFNMNNCTLVYQIIKLEKVHEKSFVIRPNERLITLVMKDLSGFTDIQFAIVGKQISSETIDKANSTPKIIFRYQTVVAFVLLLNILFFSFLILMYQKYARKLTINNYRTKYGGYRKLRWLLQITRGYYLFLALIMSFYLMMMIYQYI